MIINQEPPSLPAIAPPGITWSPEFRAFIAACLQKNPSKRPTVDELFKDHAAFFAQAKDEAYIKQNFIKDLKPAEERIDESLKAEGEKYLEKCNQTKQKRKSHQKMQFDFGSAEGA